MSNATSHRQERSTKTGLSPFVIVMNVLWKLTATMAGASVPHLLEGFFIPLWKAGFALSVPSGMAKTYPELLSPVLNVQLCLLCWDLATTAYSAGILSVLPLLMASRTVEINTEQGHDLVFFKLCCHTFYVCRCQMGEKSFQLSAKYSRQHL